MIKINNISKKFENKPILKNIDFTFETNSCNLIIGASGSGKSVLTKCMLGLLKPERGQVYFDKLSFYESSAEKRQELLHNIGMLFQGNALFDSMTVEENIRFPLDMFDKFSLKEKKIKVDEMLAKVNLRGINKLYPNELSGGMKKRVGIARAIVRNPKYLFCDEPNSGLDPQTSILIDKLIKTITIDFKMTTIVVTHDMNSVMEIGSKIMFLYQGTKHWEGSNHEIINTDNKELIDFIFASEFLQDFQQTRKYKNLN